VGQFGKERRVLRFGALDLDEVHEGLVKRNDFVNGPEEFVVDSAAWHPAELHNSASVFRGLYRWNEIAVSPYDDGSLDEFLATELYQINREQYIHSLL
jgi:hypothetical protein